MPAPRHILPVIVFAQFCCTSIWFAGNAVLSDLVLTFNLPTSALGSLTSAIQLGFILGTLVFAVFSVADRISPSRVFFMSAVAAALTNLAGIWVGNTLLTLLLSRLFTGFFLAGIYPVGMKVAADYFDKGLGQSLGFLVGALVIGTAFPHLLRGVGSNFPWRIILVATSFIALLGGLLLWRLVPDGPNRKAAKKIELSAFLRVFRDRAFRGAAFGYFGHMWELYAFWAFVPIMLKTYQESSQWLGSVPLWSFTIIGIGGAGCVVGGYLSRRVGVKQVATVALATSGICCLLFPLAFLFSGPFFLVFLMLWGLTVVADSPLFSTLVAGSAPLELKGTALTIVNCLGFAITIVSIQVLSLATENFGVAWSLPLLALGPVLGLWGLKGARALVQGGVK
ncbi:MAG: MFS transporter [Bacteroidota bacterium]